MTTTSISTADMTAEELAEYLCDRFPAWWAAPTFDDGVVYVWTAYATYGEREPLWRVDGWNVIRNGGHYMILRRSA